MRAPQVQRQFTVASVERAFVSRCFQAAAAGVAPSRALLPRNTFGAMWRASRCSPPLLRSPACQLSCSLPAAQPSALLARAAASRRRRFRGWGSAATALYVVSPALGQAALLLSAWLKFSFAPACAWPAIAILLATLVHWCAGQRRAKRRGCARFVTRSRAPSQGDDRAPLVCAAGAAKRGR